MEKRSVVTFYSTLLRKVIIIIVTTTEIKIAILIAKEMKIACEQRLSQDNTNQ